MEFVSDSLNQPAELAWIEHITRTTGCTVTPLTTAGPAPLWDLAEKLHADGFHLRPQVGARPASILMTLDGTINPMRQFPAYREIHGLPLAERQARLKDPEFRRRVLSEEAVLPRNADAVRFLTDHEGMYVMDAALTYEPSPEDSVAAVARAQGVDAREVMMDTLAAGIPAAGAVRPLRRRSGRSAGGDRASAERVRPVGWRRPLRRAGGRQRAHLHAELLHPRPADAVRGCRSSSWCTSSRRIRPVSMA